MKVLVLFSLFCTSLIAVAGPSDELNIVASTAVSPTARAELVRLLDGLASARPQILTPYKTLADFRIIIRGANERTQDLPDVIAYPSVLDWVISVGGDSRIGGGFGCTPNAPIVVVSEQNLLRLTSDPWYGESVALHELSHSFLKCATPAGLRQKVQAAFDSAKARGLWVDTYAGSDIDEYWAEGVQSFFNTNLESTPPNGIHNFVNTRQELAAYDSGLYDELVNFFGSNPWYFDAPLPADQHFISNLLTGAKRRLDVVNDFFFNNRVHIATVGNYSGQFWRMVDSGYRTFRMKTLFTGDRRCLTVMNDGSFRLRIADCTNSSGQLFKTVPSQRVGHFTLQSLFAGSERCLEVADSGARNQLQMALCRNAPGQAWQISPSSQKN